MDDYTRGAYDVLDELARAVRSSHRPDAVVRVADVERLLANARDQVAAGPSRVAAAPASQP